MSKWTALADALTCADCGHSIRSHDTGWDAAGCMADDCPCRMFVKRKPEGKPKETR